MADYLPPPETLMKTARSLALVAAWAVALAGQAFAQAYPTKVVMMRVAYPAGGPADVAARKVQVPLQAALGQPVVIENLPGAGGSIAARNVIGAPADGHTLLVSTGNDVILAPLTLQAATYKADNLRLVQTIFPADFALVTNAQHNFKSVDELVEYTKKRDQKELSFGTWGHGSAPHLVGEDFKALTGARMLDVPYKGAAPVVQALLSNEIDMAFVPLAASVVNLIETGKLKAVGIANVKRNPYLPKVPTLNEGKVLRGFSYSAWAGIFVPASLPPAAAARISHELGQIVSGADFQKFLQESAALPVERMSLEQAAAFYKSELEKFTRVAASIKLQPQ